MKTRIVLMTLCLGAGLWVGCHPVPQVAEAPRGSDGPNSGQVIFQKHCAACHGPTGKGDGYTTFNPPGIFADFRTVLGRLPWFSSDW